MKHAPIEARVDAMHDDVEQLKEDVREVFDVLRQTAKDVSANTATVAGLVGEIRGAKWGGSAASGFIGALLTAGLALLGWKLKGG